MKLVSLVGLLGTAGASHTYDLTIDMCDSSGCSPSQKRVALDANAKPGHENQVHVDGDKLTLDYAQSVGGPRVYLVEQEGVNENTKFDLAGKEFSFDVDLSTMTCGFNAALYFIGMDKNQGTAESGAGYCDAQAVGGTYCSELDLFEGNTAAQQMTTHACNDACATYSDASQCKYNPDPNDSTCDHNGCGMNPFRYGPGSSYDGEQNNDRFYGAGSSFQIDTSQAFTVTTQFRSDHIERFYSQNGKRVELPTLYVRTPGADGVYGALYGPKVTDEYCGLTYDSWPGAASHMMRNSQQGMVLSMSAWYDAETYNNGQPSGDGGSTGMSWMDGINKWGDHLTKAGPCAANTNDSGYHAATFSQLKFGDIGTTVPNLPPAPAPPAPPPTPSPPAGPGQCCHGGCGVAACSVGDWCAQNRDNCENHCSGQFCQDPAPTPPPPGPSCDCGWVDQYGCHGSDGSVCYDQCCGDSSDCDCSWVAQWGCGSSDGSQCWGVCCHGSEVSI